MIQLDDWRAGTNNPGFLNKSVTTMLDLFSGLDTHVAITLILSLGFVRLSNSSMVFTTPPMPWPPSSIPNR
ncbi:hypothetical protein [Paludibacterium denitrificans]|uniref:hypothetical protein n=1 Tax=Paludibacterium denitrificans TaxID=2675226 RepID=UPI001E2A367C|nr:hypothetical protein [Paludibacterium denitrificans]